MGIREQIHDTFPEIDEIEEENIRSGVVDAWRIALKENDVPNLEAFPWFGPYQAKLGLSNELLPDHIRDVTAAAVGIAEAFVERRDASIDLDIVIAGALVHDVSQVREVDGDEWTQAGRLLGHPYYGIYIVRAAELPVIIENIVLSHSAVTSVEPATLEAAIVKHADAATASAIQSRAYDDLREVPPASPYS